jgi:hypothetical protein
MMIVGFSHKLGDSLAVGCASWDLSSKRRQEAPLHTHGLEWALWWAGRAATSLAVISCILGARAALSATVWEGGGGWNQSLLRLIYSCSLVKKEYKLTALFISQIKREREREWWVVPTSNTTMTASRSSVVWSAKCRFSRARRSFRE